MVQTKSPKTCKKGYILRKAYTRKAYTRSDGTRVKATRVAAVCVPDKGMPGKGPKVLPKPKKGELSQFGYHNVKGLTLNQRHRALNKALREKFTPQTLVRKLTLVSNLTKNTDPRLSAMFRNDAHWVSDKYIKK